MMYIAMVKYFIVIIHCDRYIDKEGLPDQGEEVIIGMDEESIG